MLVDVDSVQALDLVEKKFGKEVQRFMVGE
jgi:hypothetical protein